MAAMSFQTFISAASCCLGDRGPGDCCTGIFSFFSERRRCSGFSVIYDILWGPAHEGSTICSGCVSVSPQSLPQSQAGLSQRWLDLERVTLALTHGAGRAQGH